MRTAKGMIVVWILAVILVGWTGVSAVEARQGYPMHGFGMHGGMFKQILTRLDLSDSQERDIANVLKHHREQMQSVRSQMIEARKAQFAAITANPINEEAVRQAAAKAAEIEVQLAVSHARVFDEIRQLLTPEQQTTLQQLAEEFSSRRHMRFHHKGKMLDRWIEENSSL